MIGRITPENIEALKPNQIIVFGSNLAGIHGGGAAKIALNKFGAVWGFGIGLCGQSFAIPTKGVSIETLPLGQIKEGVDYMIEAAKDSKWLTFLVTQIGCGLAGYTPEQIAPMFKKAIEVKNIHLPIEFWNVLNPNRPMLYESENTRLLKMPRRH